MTTEIDQHADTDQRVFPRPPQGGDSKEFRLISKKRRDQETTMLATVPKSSSRAIFDANEEYLRVECR